MTDEPQQPCLAPHQCQPIPPAAHELLLQGQAQVRHPKHNTALMGQTWSQFGSKKSVQKPGPVGRLHSLIRCLLTAHFRPSLLFQPEVILLLMVVYSLIQSWHHVIQVMPSFIQD